MAATRRIHVLSIDGGGIRGIIPARVLVDLRRRIGRELHEAFDLICGTSTGGIIALGIGTAANAGRPYVPEQLLNFYAEYGPSIFPKSVFTGAKALFGPKYSPAPLESVLQKFFAGTMLSRALTPLLITSYDLQSQLPFFFKSHRIASDPTYDWPVRQVARATSAAPTFFPPLHLVGPGGDYALVDGGIFVNNPAMAAYAEARVLYPDATEFFVVALGTGDRQDKIRYSQARGWGLIGWARQIVPVIMDSVSEAVDFEARQLLCAPACEYRRLQRRLTLASPHMDDASPENLANLQREAEDLILASDSELEAIADELRRGRGSDTPGIGRTPRNAAGSSA